MLTHENYQRIRQVGHNGCVLTIKKAAERLGLHPSQVYKMVRTGELPAYDYAAAGSKQHMWRIDEGELDEWLSAHRHHPDEVEPPPAKRARKRT